MSFKYIRGSESFKKRLAALKKEVEPQVAAALADSAKIVQQRIKQYAPVDDGDLRESIEMARASDRMTKAGANVRYKVFTDLFYSKWVELGTKNRKATPFFFPAYRVERKGVRRRVNKAIRDAIRRSSQGSGGD